MRPPPGEKQGAHRNYSTTFRPDAAAAVPHRFLMVSHHPVRRFLAVWFFSLAAAFVTAAEIPRGRILETVACASDPAQTYALYIPTGFDPAKKTPVLFCFDPGARGRAPVERFQAAAEQFGWLVAGSNNSRNGPWEANVKAINAMVGDVNRHLPIDAKRIYVTGLSGGARVACQIALGGLAQGVIACSAAFSGGETPSRLPFAFFGTAGVTDFNYRELRRVDRELDGAKSPHRVVIFDGGHEWLPPALALEAVTWLELQAMKAGTRPRDDAWLAAQFSARRAAVPVASEIEAWRALKAIAADFKGLAETGEIEQRVAALAGSPAVRAAQKAERGRERAEDNVMEELTAAIGDGLESAVKQIVAELKAKTDPADRVMATRVLQGAASSCGELARAALRQQDYAAAAPMLEMTLLLRPGRAPTYYDLARSRAALGERVKAVAALREAVAAGFKDKARLESDQAFDKVRKTPEFAAVVSGL